VLREAVSSAVSLSIGGKFLFKNMFGSGLNNF
jgi:hypothetical protein